MKEIRKPYFWSRMGFRQRAAYLCSSNQCRTFEEACSLLASQPRRLKPAPAQPVVMRYPYNND